MNNKKNSDLSYDTISTSESTILDKRYYSDLKSASHEPQKDLELMSRYRRLVDYISVAQIYLEDNCLVEEPLKKEHIKKRLLGHFGTCPAINLVYLHCNQLIIKYNLDMFLVVGPGHGAPAVLANLFVSGELGDFYPQYDQSKEGIYRLIQDFSRQGGFPSHVNPQCPGTIHEGGELGYALAVAYGAVMDNPNLIVTCIVGDGESETGPTATAWHSHKFIDPAESGAVIPILNLNGFKIASPTVFGTMSDEDLIKLFEGYGYSPRIVGTDLSNIDLDMSLSMEWAYNLIRKIQDAARSDKPIFKPHWPMIIMRTPKGMGGIKELHGMKVEGTYRSHQVPAAHVLTDEEEFKSLDNWLRSYKIQDLIDIKTGAICKELLDLCPKGRRRMGWNPHTNPIYKALTLPSIDKFKTDFDLSKRGNFLSSPTLAGGKYLAEVFSNNHGRFRIFSPDELESNKLTEVLKATTRAYQWHESMANRRGNVIEMLSEHNMQGFMQGYVLTGRFALFPSYEAFLGIITTMVEQFGKFKKICSKYSWKNATPSINYIESSTLWRQEHNGFSHQNPGFINSLVNLKSEMVRIFLPPDTNCLVSTLDHCLQSHNKINLIISAKNDNPNWLTMEEANDHCRAGASIWKWAGNEKDGREPDLVLACSGNEVTTETIAAAQLLKSLYPDISVRVVNVTDLMVLHTGIHHPHGLSDDLFNALFTRDKPVIYNFHGYPSVLKQLLFDRPLNSRFKILGYNEEGTTTTPFFMLLCNHTSRYDVAMEAIKSLVPLNPAVASTAGLQIAELGMAVKKVTLYINENNTDPEYLQKINWKAQKIE
jgi:xylulose-5-phosphate/fructose-6-phosphate phosphoketolase